MKSILSKIIAATFLLSASSAAFSQVKYEFHFSNLVGIANPNQRANDFNITLTYPDYVTTTGLFALGGTPRPTSLGAPVAYAGTNPRGWFAFDDDGQAILTDDSYTAFGNSFIFNINSQRQTNYLHAPGTYYGYVVGNAAAFNNSGFSGSGILTVTAVPEPETYALMIAGLGLIVLRRKRATMRA